jgi:hypothetical protein
MMLKSRVEVIACGIIAVVLCLAAAMMTFLVLLASDMLPAELALLVTDTPTPSPTATFTVTPTSTATPTPTPTPTATSTASPTFTPLPVPTDTPLPPTPPPPPTQAPAPPPPTDTPLPPTEPPSPQYDFRIEYQRRFSIGENGGCNGMHTIFISVKDLAGNPLDDIVVGDPYGNVEEVTGKKGPGKTEIDLWQNTLEIMVKRDAGGNPVGSEIGMPMSARTPEISDEELIAAGYCADQGDCSQMRTTDPFRCHGHFSYEIIFRRAW